LAGGAAPARADHLEEGGRPVDRNAGRRAGHVRLTRSVVFRAKPLGLVEANRSITPNRNRNRVRRSRGANGPGGGASAPPSRRKTRPLPAAGSIRLLPEPPARPTPGTVPAR